MTEKRFRYDTGCFIDMQENKVLSEIQATNLLNKLVKENEHIKQTIKDMINTERTELGRSVLKQLWEQIQ